LFRGKRVAVKEWVYGYLVIDDEGTHFIYARLPTKKNGWDSQLVYEVIPETVGQFTGLRDSKKKKVFCEDTLLLIDGNGEKSIQSIDQDHLGYCVEIELEDRCDVPLGFVKQYEYTFEVIGNLHDDPNL